MRIVVRNIALDKPQTRVERLLYVAALALGGITVFGLVVAVR